MFLFGNFKGRSRNRVQKFAKMNFGIWQELSTRRAREPDLGIVSSLLIAQQVA